MSEAIFVSYRRDDAKHAAGRLFDRLSRTHEKIFIDVDNIPPGADFRKVLSEKVAACNVLLAVIGPIWVECQDEDGVRRLDDPSDFVRIEIEEALARDVRVIPVLVDGAKMPRSKDLPSSLQPLTFRNAVRLSHERFSADADDLSRSLSPRGPQEVSVKAVAPSTPDAAERPVRATSAPTDSTKNWGPVLAASVYLLAGLAVPPSSGSLAQTVSGVTERVPLIAASAASLALLCFAVWRCSQRDAKIRLIELAAYCIGSVLPLWFILVTLITLGQGRGTPSYEALVISSLSAIVGSLLAAAVWWAALRRKPT